SQPGRRGDGAGRVGRPWLASRGCRAAGASGRGCDAGLVGGQPVGRGRPGRPRMSRADHPLLRDPGYALLKRRILAVTGLAYFQDKDEALAERLERRLTACGAAGCAAYLALLEADPAHTGEWDALVGELTI